MVPPREVFGYESPARSPASRMLLSKNATEARAVKLMDRRAVIRESVAYLRATRSIVQSVAAEHANWVQFIASTASTARAGVLWQRPSDQLVAARYSMIFTMYGNRVKAMHAPDYCRSVQESLARWVEALDLLSNAYHSALELKNGQALVEIVREAHEAQLRLRTFQRTYERTVVGVRQLFKNRPRVVGRRVLAMRSPLRGKSVPRRTMVMRPTSLRGTV